MSQVSDVSRPPPNAYPLMAVQDVGDLATDNRVAEFAALDVFEATDGDFVAEAVIIDVLSQEIDVDTVGGEDRLGQAVAG